MGQFSLDDRLEYLDINGNTISGIAKKSSNSKVNFHGKNCKVTICEDVILESVVLNFATDNSSIYIGPASLFRGFILLGMGCRVNIAGGLTVTASCRIETAECVDVNIGNDCMFASEVQIRADDSHPIFDIETNERLNASKTINIGNRVWIGYDAVILSGALIGDGSVVGMRSIVKGEVPKNSICAGVPARVIKEGVSWERSNLKTKPPYLFTEPSEPIRDFRV